MSKLGHTDISITHTSKEIPLNKSLDSSEIKQLSPGSCFQLLTKSLSNLSFRVHTFFSYTHYHIYVFEELDIKFCGYTMLAVLQCVLLFSRYINAKKK